MKRIVSLALVMLLILGLNGAFAETPVAAIKSTYKIENEGSKSPAETFIYKFTPVKVEENSALTKNDMPEIDDVEVPFDRGAATVNGFDKTVDVALSTIEWPGLGVYYYTVQQEAGTTAGVTYDSSTAYLKVTVAYDEVAKDKYYVAFCTVSLADANDDGITDIKEDDFENIFKSGELAIKKTVTGNMGDKSKYFDIKVKLTGDPNLTYDASFAVDGGSKDGNPETISLGTETIFGLKDGETITISNLPYGVTYTVEEADYTTETEGYDDPDYDFSDENKKIDSANDTVEITNNKGTVIDTGVIVDNLPYVAMLALVALAAVAMILKKRVKND